MTADKKAMEQSAVRLSFWIGGVGLVVLKGIAYFISSSSLVKAAMFESMGDVLSSAIMAVTQSRVADSSDCHLYPVGKGRLTPIGILAFAAFAASTMSGLAIQSLQGLVSGEDATPSDSGAAVRRLFEEQPRLRRGLRQHQVDALIEQYGSQEVPEVVSGMRFAMALVVACIAFKGALYMYCALVAKKTGSDIAKTLALDHRNDVLTNILVVLVTGLVSGLEGLGHNWPWLSKVDPAASLLLSIYIAYSWVGTALEQVHVLSNRSADEDIASAITVAARGHLEAGALELCSADVYHVGEGYAVSLQVYPRPGKDLQAGVLATALESLEVVVRAACEEVNQVNAKLVVKPVTAPPDGAWAAGYSALAR